MEWKYYLMKFPTGSEIHFGYTVNVHGFFGRPAAICCDTVRRCAYVISKELTLEETKKKITCEKCKERAKMIKG